jgi:ubiquinone/menaquinone biosynthesis C-methylase UbiE
MDWLKKVLRPEASQKRAAPPPLEIAAFFDAASRDEEHFPSTIDERILHVRTVLDWCGDLNGKTVADVGCGKGRFARIVKERNPRALVVGIDISEAMLRAVPPSVAACTGSLTAIPLLSGSCDAAYATESLEHAVDIGAAISELCRILKSGGRLVIIDKNKDHWGRFKTPEWEQWFGQKELESMLKRHCGKVESHPISYWEEETPDGLFLAWLAEK